jgi:hypothetical protein
LALFACCCEQYSATKTAAAILQRYSFYSSYYSWLLFLKDQVYAANNTFAADPTNHRQILVQHGGMMNRNTTPSSKASRLMRSQSLHGNAAANDLAVNSILQLQQRHHPSWKSAPAPAVPVLNQQQMRYQQQVFGTTTKAAPGPAMRNHCVVQRQVGMKSPSSNIKAGIMQSHLLQGDTAAVNGVPVNNILEQHQQQQRSWKGAPTVPIQNRQPMRPQRQYYQPVSTTTHQGPPQQQANLPQARPVNLSSPQVQGQGHEFRNKNNPFGGRSDSNKNVNSAAAPGSRMPQEYGRPVSGRVQVAASTATSNAGNTIVQRMHQQRHTILQPGFSGPGPGDVADGRHHSERRLAGGQQQLAHVTPTIQHMASRGASFRPAQQAQMFSDSRPLSNQPRNLQGQMQRQGSGQHVVAAHPVVGQYERGSFKNGQVDARVYSGHFSPQQRNLRVDFYESQQQGQGEHLSNLSMESGGEGEYAAGYLNGLQHAIHGMSIAGVGPTNKEKSSKSMASQMLQGITRKNKNKPKKGVVENNNTGAVQMQY